MSTEDTKNIEHTEHEETSENIQDADNTETSANTQDTGSTNDTAKEQAFQEIYEKILEHFRSFSPADHIAAQITEEHISEYLEASREEKIQQYRERREKRWLSALKLFAALAAIVLVVYFLKDNPAILVNILYLIGGLSVFYLWKRPGKENERENDTTDRK